MRPDPLRDDPLFLFEIEDAFQIKGLGLVLVPGLPVEKERLANIQVKIGDSVVLKARSGSLRYGKIKSFQSPRGLPLTHIPLTLENSVKMDAELVGSKVFLAPTSNRET